MDHHLAKIVLDGAVAEVGRAHVCVSLAWTAHKGPPARAHMCTAHHGFVAGLCGRRYSGCDRLRLIGRARATAVVMVVVVDVVDNVCRGRGAVNLVVTFGMLRLPTAPHSTRRPPGAGRWGGQRAPAYSC